MNYDNDVLGVGAYFHPANETREEKTELEILCDELYEEKCKLRDKLFDIEQLCKGFYPESGLAVLILNKIKK